MLAANFSQKTFGRKRAVMTEAQKIAWGVEERGRRLDDMAAVHLNNISLDDAKWRAIARAEKSGMSAEECARYLRKSRQ